MTPRRRPRDRGSAPVELAVFIGMILLPVLILVTTLPMWWERQSLGRLAAQEAARAVVLADTREQGVASGLATAHQLAVNHGVDPAHLSVTFAGTFDRGGAITATSTVTVPALAVPFITSVPSFRVSFSHTEAIDQYRSFPLR